MPRSAAVPKGGSRLARQIQSHEWEQQQWGRRQQATTSQRGLTRAANHPDISATIDGHDWRVAPGDGCASLRCSGDFVSSVRAGESDAVSPGLSRRWQVEGEDVPVEAPLPAHNQDSPALIRHRAGPRSVRPRHRPTESAIAANEVHPTAGDADEPISDGRQATPLSRSGISRRCGKALSQNCRRGSVPRCWWRLTILIVVAALLGTSCGGDEGPRMMGLPFDEYTHEDEPFAQRLFSEQASLPQSDDAVLQFVLDDYDGEYVHVEGLARRSFQPPGEGPEIWFFGGSTLFGIGQRDEHTIPSEVARRALATGVTIHVSSFAAPSYASWQEVELLRRALATREAPDLIVFYHGANDMGIICRQLALGVTPDGLGNPLLDTVPDDPKVRCVDQPDATGQLLAAAVSNSMANAIAMAGSIPVVHYWQPFAATRKQASSDPELLKRLNVSDERGRTGQAAAYRAALPELDPPAIDLTTAMDTAGGPIYFDWAHTNEAGARLVAAAMWDGSLRQTVAELKSPGIGD